MLVVRLPDRREGLVPFVREIVPTVDVSGGRVVLTPPENTTPGISDTAAESAGLHWLRSPHGTGDTCIMIFPLARSSANRPPPAAGSSRRVPSERNHRSELAT